MGDSRALDQGRLEEARALGALAASLGRIPEQTGDRVDWADFARAVMDPTTALELSFEGEDGLVGVHPAKFDLWRRLTGEAADDPTAVKMAALRMMTSGLLDRLAEGREQPPEE